MRPLLAILLAGLLLVPMNTASALHEEGPVQQAEEPSWAFREAIYELNRTIRDVEEKVGDDPAIDKAKQKRAKAAQAFVAGNHWLTLGHLLEATAIIERVNAEYENRDASDSEAAYYSDMESTWQEADAWMADVHERLLQLQSEGVDLWMLDHALLAGAILAEGERLHKGWPGVSKAWENGQRGRQMKNALGAMSHGAILHAKVASGILDRAVRNQTDEPVGPVVGNSTLRGVMDSLDPMIRNGSVSFDREFTGIINGNIAEQEWLAALGATVAWSQNQAPAAVQHVIDKPEDERYDPVAVTEHLRNLTENDHRMDQLEELGVPGAQARYHLSKTTAMLSTTEREIESGNETYETAMRAAEGLGALSAAHTGTAILTVAAGQDPPDAIIHLPSGAAGAMELGNGTGGGDEGGGSGLGAPGAGALAALGLIGLAAAVWHKRRGPRS